jgi:hypothetical protein
LFKIGQNGTEVLCPRAVPKRRRSHRRHIARLHRPGTPPGGMKERSQLKRLHRPQAFEVMAQVKVG